jgi:hypothetical protein
MCVKHVPVSDLFVLFFVRYSKRSGEEKKLLIYNLNLVLPFFLFWR